ncbi:MAG: 50S ribosomal protein L30 [Candidatus Neomarinimicrobiota bacterium]
MKNLKITQVKSGIGYRQKTKQTLAALGLRKMNQSVIKADSAAIRGMLKNIDFLVKVEEIK